MLVLEGSVGFRYVCSLEVSLILLYTNRVSQCLEMNRKRLSSRDFLALADIIWNGAAKVRYKNPDAWIIL
jgi:hypothetical protein